ncbi:MAG: DinB family protein [Acidobacteriia bacterium]|nr:DinB family protein [Terriglobia bacterium]
MNSTVSNLIHQAASARVRLLATTAQLTEEEAGLKPGNEQWSISNIVEHLVLSEHYELNKLWQTMEEARSGKKWSGEHIHRGLSIEEVIARTWKPQEQTPPYALPRIGGPLAYWKECLICSQSILDVLGNCLEGLDLESMIFPHPLAGPLDARQRLELIRLHMDRHVAQIERIRAATPAR